MGHLCFACMPRRLPRTVLSLEQGLAVWLCLCSLDGASRRKLLPERLFAVLLCCLDDENHRVKRAAAIALYALNRPNYKVE